MRRKGRKEPTKHANAVRTSANASPRRSLRIRRIRFFASPSCRSAICLRPANSELHFPPHQPQASDSARRHEQARGNHHGTRTGQEHSTAQHSTAQHSTAQHSTAHHTTAQHSTPHHTTAQHSTAQRTHRARRSCSNCASKPRHSAVRSSTDSCN